MTDMTNKTVVGSSKERLTEIRSSAEVGKANGITAERRYGGDAYADRVWLVTEVDRLQDRCAEFEANLTIAERQVTEARNDLDRLHDTMRGERAGFETVVSALAAERVPLRYGKPFTGIHRGISRGGFHCTDNDCSCHLYQYPRAELKAFVQLCAPHGKDWLTCPECAKAAGFGGAR